MRAASSRAGVGAMIAVAMLAVLVTADALSGHLPALVPEDDQPIVLPFTHPPAEGRLTEGVIPLGRTEISVPILMYHYIQDLSNPVDTLTYNLTVTPENFSRQMLWLRLHGYHPITFADLRAYFARQRRLPSRPVVITIDDGYRDLYTTAFPILQANSFKAVAYIVTSFVGRPRYVTAAMILEMDRYGIEIASHTVDHADLARETAPEVAYEVGQSKAWLEKLLGHPVLDFAYPSGRFNLQAEDELRAAGYSTAVTELPGSELVWFDRYEWPRDRVSGGETLTLFIKDLGPVEPYILVTQGSV